MVMAYEDERTRIDPDKVYTVRETANLLQVSEQVVRTEMNEGKLRFKRVGRQIRVKGSMINDYLDGK